MFFCDIHLTEDCTATTVGFHRYRPIATPANYRIRFGDAAGPTRRTVPTYCRGDRICCAA